jgi:hypothetical protein
MMLACDPVQVQRMAVWYQQGEGEHSGLGLGLWTVVCAPTFELAFSATSAFSWHSDTEQMYDQQHSPPPGLHVCPYADFASQSQMDKIRFCKVLRDARLTSEAGPPAGLNSSEADKIFRTVLPTTRVGHPALFRYLPGTYLGRSQGLKAQAGGRHHLAT